MAKTILQLKKIREIHDDDAVIDNVYCPGPLVAEVFRDCDFIALLSIERVCLKNKKYLLCDVKEDYISLKEKDFDAVRKGISEWSKVRDSLWGRIAQGHSWCGRTGKSYYAPNSDEELLFREDESGKVGEPKDLGTLEEKLRLGDLEFTFERFTFSVKQGIQRDKIPQYSQGVIFDKGQESLIEESFIVYNARKGIYAPKSGLDFHKCIPRY